MNVANTVRKGERANIYRYSVRETVTQIFYEAYCYRCFLQYTDKFLQQDLKTLFL